MHFCRLGSVHPNPELTLNGTLIPVVEQTKFLEVIFDNKLAFLPHIRYLKEKCVKALNLLHVVAHTYWGADQHTLLHLYRSLVRTKLDYGSVVHGSARESYLGMLDPIQKHALRLCLGAFKTSPASSMCVQANEPPPYIRRRMLSIQYSLRTGTSPSNPAYNTVFNAKCKASFSSKLNQIPTLGIRIAPELEKIGFKRNTVSLFSIPATPPWLLRHPEIDLSLYSPYKAVTSPEVFKIRFYELCDRFKKSIIFIPTVLTWAKEFRRPCAINPVRQLFRCRVQQASSMRNFTLSCLPWMLSEDLKKNTLSCCQTHIQI